MIVDQLTGATSITRKAGVKNALVLGVDVSIFARQRDRKMSIALALRIEHCTQRQHPRAVATGRKRRVEGRVRGRPARAQT